MPIIDFSLDTGNMKLMFVSYIDTLLSRLCMAACAAEASDHISGVIQASAQGPVKNGSLSASEADIRSFLSKVSILDSSSQRRSFFSYAGRLNFLLNMNLIIDKDLPPCHLNIKAYRSFLALSHLGVYQCHLRSGYQDPERIDWIRFRSVAEDFFRRGEEFNTIFDIMRATYGKINPERDTLYRWERVLNRREISRLAGVLNHSIASIGTAIDRDLRMKRVSLRWIPHILSQMNLDDRMET
ncbi:MAG: hypothetical protein EZS28_001204 [Streblomastix strix]|uniref:Uncharacterized protein n=1 Tax=Streblomastix strix TaxID=222440 RepID=A0A5J4X7Q3_9EUKA|nr:MAG: hypothetical protein EZS28_001204 [Streblomastix strix]